MAQEISVAVLTLKNAGDMTPEGRREIARWLEGQARSLVEDGEKYAGRFRARYIVPGRDSGGATS